MSFEGPEGFSFDQEPKRVFVNFLIFTLKRCEWNIYFGDSPTQAIRPLRGLIDGLDKDSFEKLKSYRDTLQSWETNLGGCTRVALEELYQGIVQYLHTTYLREIRFARPKYKSEGELEIPET